MKRRWKKELSVKDWDWWGWIGDVTSRLFWTIIRALVCVLVCLSKPEPSNTNTNMFTSIYGEAYPDRWIDTKVGKRKREQGQPPVCSYYIRASRFAGQNNSPCQLLHVHELRRLTLSSKTAPVIHQSCRPQRWEIKKRASRIISSTSPNGKYDERLINTDTMIDGCKYPVFYQHENARQARGNPPSLLSQSWQLYSPGNLLPSVRSQTILTHSHHSEVTVNMVSRGVKG